VTITPGSPRGWTTCAVECCYNAASEQKCAGIKRLSLARRQNIGWFSSPKQKENQRLTHWSDRASREQSAGSDRPLHSCFYYILQKKTFHAYFVHVLEIIWSLFLFSYTKINNICCSALSHNLQKNVTATNTETCSQMLLDTYPKIKRQRIIGPVDIMFSILLNTTSRSWCRRRRISSHESLRLSPAMIMWIIIQALASMIIPRLHIPGWSIPMSSIPGSGWLSRDVAGWWRSWTIHLVVLPTIEWATRTSHWYTWKKDLVVTMFI